MKKKKKTELKPGASERESL